MFLYEAYMIYTFLTAFLVGLCIGRQSAWIAEESLDELRELSRTAGAEEVALAMNIRGEFRRDEGRLAEALADYGEAIRLFDGETLEGWTFSSDAQKETWSAGDGLLALSGRPTGYIRTRECARPYEFRHN